MIACKVSGAGNTMELLSLHSQRAQGDKQTLSLSVHWSQQLEEKRRDVLGRENIFICFLHAETRRSRWQMMVERIRAQLTSSLAKTTSDRTAEESVHFLAMARAARRGKTYTSLRWPWLVRGTQQGPGSLHTEQVQHWPRGCQQAQVCKLLCSSHQVKQD